MTLVRAEAIGVVLVDAMAASLLIITTHIARSCVSWVNQHGVTGSNVPVGDAPALASALVALPTDRDRARAMGEADRHRFLQRFTASAVVSATDALSATARI